jgi:hypothetical protein
VTVRANWRLIDRFENGNAYDVSLIDYPGRIVKHECLEPLNLTVKRAAEILGVTRQALSKLDLKNASVQQLTFMEPLSFPLSSRGADLPAAS